MQGTKIQGFNYEKLKDSKIASEYINNLNNHLRNFQPNEQTSVKDRWSY